MNGLASADLYVQATQFYAHQMRAHDERGYERFASTFAEDGTFEYGAPGMDPVAVGPKAIVVALRRIDAAHYPVQPFQRRHWVNQMVMDPLVDDMWAVEFATLLIMSRPDSGTQILVSCMTKDVLLRLDGSFRTKSRSIALDGDSGLATL